MQNWLLLVIVSSVDFAPRGNYQQESTRLLGIRILRGQVAGQYGWNYLRLVLLMQLFYRKMLVDGRCLNRILGIVHHKAPWSYTG